MQTSLPAYLKPSCGAGALCFNWPAAANDNEFVYFGLKASVPTCHNCKVPTMSQNLLNPPRSFPTPPSPAPSADSQLDGGEFFHVEEYLKHQGDQVQITDESGVEGSGADGEEEEGSEEDGEVDFEEGSSVGNFEADREGKIELTEVWPQPKEDGHAFVAADGGVRRRRTTTAGGGDGSAGKSHTEMPRW